MKPKSKFILVLIPLFILALSMGCSKKTQKNPQEIKEYSVAGHTLYIPEAYTDFGYTGAGGSSVLLQAWYPGSAPVPGDAHELWERGEWYKDVRILIDFPPKPNPLGVMKSNIELNQARKKVRDEYGLSHYTQYDENVGFNDDIFIDDWNTGSFIGCSKTFGANYSIPICKHIFAVGSASFNISYDKRLLPYWKTIKKNVIELFQSFHSQQSAKTYISKFYPLTEGN